MTASTPPVRLHARDVLALWNAELERAGRPTIKPRTLSMILFESWPAPEGHPPRRYEHDPMPLPRYPHPDRPHAGQKPYWEPDPGETREGLEKRLLDWWRVARPGRGRGARPNAGPRRRRCGCGSGEMAYPGTPCGQCGLGLTVRERAVCALAVLGFTIPEMARQLQVRQATVHSQLRSSYRKLGVHSRVELTTRWGQERRALPTAPVPAEAG